MSRPSLAARVSRTGPASRRSAAETITVSHRSRQSAATNVPGRHASWDHPSRIEAIDPRVWGDGGIALPDQRWTPRPTTKRLTVDVTPRRVDLPHYVSSERTSARLVTGVPSARGKLLFRSLSAGGEFTLELTQQPGVLRDG